MSINLFILECKFLSGNKCGRFGDCINLFILECKYGRATTRQTKSGWVLIFSYWNVNTQYPL